MIGYKHNFPKSGKELTADFTYNASRSNSSNSIRTDSLDYSTKNIVKSSSQRQDGTGANKNFIFKEWKFNFRDFEESYNPCLAGTARQEALQAVPPATARGPSTSCCTPVRFQSLPWQIS